MGRPFFTDETVGREADTIRVAAALRNARLVTLVGPPASARAGSRASPRIPGTDLSDGITCVDCSHLADTADAFVALAAALDIAIDSSNIASSVRETLRERDALIVLDNVPIKAAARVAELWGDLLAAAPDLSILATSRAALGATEERTMVIAGLSLEASVELLRVRSGTTDLAALHEAVRPLAGVPAAIEHAVRFVARDVREEFDVLEGASL